MSYLGHLNSLEGIDRIKHIVHYLRVDLLPSEFKKIDTNALISTVDQDGYNILEWTLKRLSYRKAENQANPITTPTDICDTLDRIVMSEDRSIQDLHGYIMSLHAFYVNSRGKGYQYSIDPLHYSNYRSLSSIDNYDSRMMIRNYAFHIILENIASRCPSLITDRMMRKVNKWNSQPIIELLTSHKIDNDDDSESCYICTLTYRDQLITPPCACKSKIHLQCLIKLIKSNGGKCMTCKKSFECKRFTPKGGAVLSLFPKIGVYPNPLTSKYILLKDDEVIQQLYFAIIYVQVDRVEQLLDRMDKETLTSYITNTMNYEEYAESDDVVVIDGETDGETYEVLRYDYYKIHRIEDNNLSLLDKLWTGLSRKGHLNKFSFIDGLINSKIEGLQIDINQITS